MNKHYEPGPAINASQKEIDMLNFKNTIAVLKKKSIASPQTGERMCKDCFEVKSLELFTKSICTKDGRTNTCKACTSKNKKLYNIIKRYGRV